MSLPFAAVAAPGEAPVAALSPADVLRLGQRMPSTPQIFNRIGRLLGDPNSGLDEVASLVKLDASLALRVLQMSNAAFYGFRERCGSLDEAVRRLGFREVHRVVGVIASQHLFCNELTVHGISASLAWENSVACALAMEALGRRRRGDGGDAYACGLLRSVGKIVLNRVLIERPTVCCRYPGEGVAPSAHAWERRTFGMSAAEAAAILMDGWKFPRVLCEAVRYHLEPEAAPGAPVEAVLLNLAGGIAAGLGKGLPGEGACLQVTPGRLQRAGLTEADLQECAAHTQAAFAKLRAACR